MYQKVSKARFYKNAMHHLMDDILQEIKQPTKFSSQDSTGLLFLRTVLNGLSYMINAKEWKYQQKA